MNERTHGFTLLEMIVVVAIIVALAGVLVPIVTHELDDAKKATAQTTVHRLAAALTQFHEDTAFSPTGRNGAQTYHYLYTVGKMPASNTFASGKGGRVEDFLSRNQTRTTGWRGPYLQGAEADPWGSQYLINTQGFFAVNERAWVLSAGPNRRVETRPDDTKPHGDDIAIFLE